MHEKVEFFIGAKILICFFSLVIACECKSYPLWQNMSSFHNQGTELWPKNHFRLFLTIFELFVLDWFLLMLDHSQTPPQVGIYPYYKFRTQLLKYSDSKCKKYQIFFWDICWKKTLFPGIFSRFYLIAGPARPQGTV